jgi:hypothetical protein
MTHTTTFSLNAYYNYMKKGILRFGLITKEPVPVHVNRP